MQNIWRVTFLTKGGQKLIREYLADTFNDLEKSELKKLGKDLKVIKIEQIEEEIRTVGLCTEMPDIPPYKYPGTITYGEVKPHTYGGKGKDLYVSDNYNDNIILCNKDK